MTTGVTKKLTGAGASASAAYIGDSSWSPSTGTLLGVPNFGTLTFTNCRIDGKALASPGRRAGHRAVVKAAVRVGSAAGARRAPAACRCAHTVLESAPTARSRPPWPHRTQPAGHPEISRRLRVKTEQTGSRGGPGRLPRHGLPAQPGHRPQPRKWFNRAPVADAHIPRLQRCRLNDNSEVGPNQREPPVPDRRPTAAVTLEVARHDHRVRRHGAGFPGNRLRAVPPDHFQCLVARRGHRGSRSRVWVRVPRCRPRRNLGQPRNHIGRNRRPACRVCFVHRSTPIKSA